MLNLLLYEPGQRSRYGDWIIEESLFDYRQWKMIFLCSWRSRPALGPTQPLIQSIPEVLPPEIKRKGGATEHAIPIPRIKKSGDSSQTCTPLTGIGKTLPFKLITFDGPKPATNKNCWQPGRNNLLYGKAKFIHVTWSNRHKTACTWKWQVNWKKLGSQDESSTVHLNTCT
jgi:hypothetical protein